MSYFLIRLSDRHNVVLIFFFNDTATTEIYTLSLHDALPIYLQAQPRALSSRCRLGAWGLWDQHPREVLVSPVGASTRCRSEEHTSELQSRLHLVCRLLLEKKKKENIFTCRHRMLRTTC